MDDICRLCCSTKFVGNNIFDEENALYLKMSLYLPIKVFKNDGLPQKVCDKCSCKVNDLYQFCNETIEVQRKLRSLFLANCCSTDIVDLTRVKKDASPPPELQKFEQSTQTDWDVPLGAQEENTPHTDDKVRVKTEEDEQQYSTLSPIKEELSLDTFQDAYSDDSDNMSLFNLKQLKTDGSEENGIKKRGKKKKDKLKDWDMLMNVLPEATSLSLVSNNMPHVTRPSKFKENDILRVKKVKVVKDESTEEVDQEISLHCCICFTKCHSRRELGQHYKKHEVKEVTEAPAPPAPPPLPGKEPLRCQRCDRSLSREQWARHWARHWALDRRPYRCGLCEKTFSHIKQILKHGLTHAAGAEAAAAGAGLGKRFACDACPEAFVFLRSLAAHRARLHPEAAARPLALRCGQCKRSFAHANSLRRHLRSHSGERNFLCNVCGKVLTSREHLKFHIRIHTGDKRNVCGVCGKGFVKKSNLTLHERVHSGEKPHVCSHCGKAFSQRSTLVIHERYHSGARPYVCALCGRGFVAKGLLTMHLKSTCI